MDPALATGYAHLTANYMFQTSNYVLYIYDHLLTLPEEVGLLIGKTMQDLPIALDRLKRSGLNLLPLRLCFSTLIGTSPTANSSFFKLSFTRQHGLFQCTDDLLFDFTYIRTKTNFRCDRYVKFAGAATMSLVTSERFEQAIWMHPHPEFCNPLYSCGAGMLVSVVMIFRVYALYLCNRYILGSLLSILAGQVIVMAWAIHFGVRVPLPPGFPGCVLTGRSTWFGGSGFYIALSPSHVKLAALWGAPLVTDSFIFLLTLWRTLRYRKRHGRMGAIEIILRDGTMYFFAIFSANLMNCLIYFLATEDLKAVGASFSQILTAILISRLQLNLRRVNGTGAWKGSDQRRHGGLSSWHQARADRETTGTFFTIGNLGEELQGTFFETPDDTKDDYSEDFD
ncbi:hypothetical protein Hypma_001419 [Hypsizygus marmoreus]|uniref:Uncharacterized protein n=1 Tax=Hypsizygus marmoreus TaxID=39966 RepID=A0A369K655_HYPMA|nr:hypothetical protein Hypma_001419 [Hypsizygus marmoreus]